MGREVNVMKYSSVRVGYRCYWLSAQMLLIGGLSQEAGAAPLGVGYRETLALAVPDATTTNLTDRLLVSEGTFNKTGAGTLVLAVSNLMTQSNGKIIVRNGSLRMDKDTNASVAPAPCPTEIMAQAAFWVDATTNVIAVSSNGNAYADAWLDVRETNTAGPYAYVRAVANMAKTNCAPQVQINAGPNGQQASIWFGRFGSLRTMTWTTPAGATADIANICHVFLLHGIFFSNGFILGCFSGNPDFHITDFTNGGTNVPIWSATEYSTTAVRQGRTYLDGERIDGTLVWPKPGWQLLEVALGTSTAHAANFYNDRNIDFSGKRLGGDNLCEAVIFTNRLSETDRLRVQQYLVQKWLGRKSIAAFTAAAASASGTVIANVAGGGSMTARLDGNGALQKQGNGTLILDDVPAVKSVFRSATLLGGVLDARIPVPLALTAGDHVAATNTALTLTQDAGSGRIVKDGSNTVTLTAFPQGVSSVTVNEGTLILTPPSVSTSTVAETVGSVSNANFELVQNTANRYVIANGTTYCGWTAYTPSVTGGADNAVFIFNKSVASDALWPCNYDAPEGKQVLALKRDSSASTTMTLPVAGVYDVSFYTSGRTGYGNHEFDLCLIDGTVTNRVATVQTVPQPYVRQSFRLPWLAAGDHTLLLQRNGQGVDSLGTLDDFKVQLVSEVQSDSLKIFNGDFELTGYPRNPAAFTTSNLASGWVFTASTNNEVSAGITMSGSSSSFYTPSSAYGSVLLGIVSNGCASTTMTLPVGTYRLQADICNWPCYLGKALAATQQLKATVTRADGGSVVLGTVSTNASFLSTAVWPTAFAVTNNETVTLTLAGQTTASGGLVDNLVLLPQKTPIVQNGGFEIDANWAFEYSTNVLKYAMARYSPMSDTNFYGTAIYEGVRRLALVQTGAAAQDIQIPAAGLYRLVLHAVRRVDSINGDIFGNNPVRAWLAQGGVTNVIGWTRVDDPVFVRREFLFPVAAAGTYRFGLQGMTDNSPAFPGNDKTTLLDGVSIDPATDLASAGIVIPKALSLTVGNGARLQLSYTGTQTVNEVRYAGRLVTGLMNQQTRPEFVSGPGALFALPKGTVINIH